MRGSTSSRPGRSSAGSAPCSASRPDSWCSGTAPASGGAPCASRPSCSGPPKGATRAVQNIALDRNHRRSRLYDAMRRAPLAALIAFSALADPVVPREPFAKAHVSLMARSQAGSGEARLAEIDLWAEGTRLRARVRGEPMAGEVWVDGLASEALRIVGGKVVEPKKRSLEQGLKLSLATSPSLANANTDRIAGHPCKIVSEDLPGGVQLTRCLWRGLPLSVEVKAAGYSFNA